MSYAITIECPDDWTWNQACLLARRLVDDQLPKETAVFVDGAGASIRVLPK